MHSETKPTTATPAECPNPQRTPGTHPRREDRTDSGATAAKWSGPAHTWITPAINPATGTIIIFHCDAGFSPAPLNSLLPNVRYPSDLGKENFRGKEMSSSKLERVIHTPTLGTARTIHIRIVRIDVAAAFTSKNAVLARARFEAAAAELGVNSNTGNSGQQDDRVCENQVRD
jgi:hypothetical protein